MIYANGRKGDILDGMGKEFELGYFLSGSGKIV